MQVSLDKTLDRFKFSYVAHRGVRFVIYSAFLGVGWLLLWATSGSGVQLWHILVQALSSLPPLWRARGPVTLLLLLAVLLAQIVAWLTLWCLFAWASGAILRHCWRQRHKPQCASIQGSSWQRQQLYADTDNIVVPQQLKVAEPILVEAGPPEGATPGTGFSANLIPTSPSPPQSPPQPEPRQEAPIWSFETGPLHALENSGPLVPAVSVQSSPLHMRVGLASDAGIKHRTRPNEDSLIAIQGTRTFSSRLLSFDLFAVADGVGGGTHGQEASNMAVQAMLESVFPRLMSSDMLDDQVLLEVMTRGVNQANRVLYQRNLKDTTEMGATMTAALVVESRAYVVNVGDSRTYHYCSHKGLKQVTRDHSLVARLVDASIISPEDVYAHPDRGLIYRSLGKEARVEIDTFRLQLQAGDSLLLCSDGLWEVVRDPHIQQLLGDDAASPMQATTNLVNAALEGGGEDDVSVIVAHV